MTSKLTSIQINPLECVMYEGTICNKKNCVEFSCDYNDNGYDDKEEVMWND